MPIAPRPIRPTSSEPRRCVFISYLLLAADGGRAPRAAGRHCPLGPSPNHQPPVGVRSVVTGGSADHGNTIQSSDPEQVHRTLENRDLVSPPRWPPRLFPM